MGEKRFNADGDLVDDKTEAKLDAMLGTFFKDWIRLFEKRREVAMYRSRRRSAIRR